MATDHKTVADEIADRNPRSFEARWRMRVHRIADQPIWTHPLARVVAAVGAALLLAEQNVSFARRCTDYVYLLDTGRVVFSGSWEAFDAQPELKTRYLAV